MMKTAEKRRGSESKDCRDCYLAEETVETEEKEDRTDNFAHLRRKKIATNRIITWIL